MVTFSVPRMKCGGCADSVTSVLRKLDGKATIDIDLDKKEVEFDGDVSKMTLSMLFRLPVIRQRLRNNVIVITRIAVTCGL